MDLSKIIKDWKQLGFWNQSAFVITFIGTIVGILSLAEISMQITNWVIPIFVLALLFFIYGNIQQSRKLADANNKLRNVPNEIDKAAQKVYQDNREKMEKLQLQISNLETEVATWKDKVSSWQDKANSWKKECEGYESKISELLNLVQRERIDADKRVEEAKRKADEECLEDFRRFLEIKTGKIHTVDGWVKLKWNQESDQHLVEQLSTQDERDVAGDIIRKRSRK